MRPSKGPRLTGQNCCTNTGQPPTETLIGSALPHQSKVSGAGQGSPQASGKDERSIQTQGTDFSKTQFHSVQHSAAQVSHEPDPHIKRAKA